MSGEADRQAILDEFFTHWIHRYKVVATVEGALKFETARRAWWRVEADIVDHGQTIDRLQRERNYHKAKHQEWLTAYQNTRCKHVGDYTRMFVRRPRLRRFVLFLLRL